MQVVTSVAKTCQRIPVIKLHQYAIVHLLVLILY